MNIFKVIKSETAGVLEKTAVVEGKASISYKDLLSAAEKVAESLKFSGVGKLHRVGLLSEDSIDYIIASLAILSLYAVIVPISPEQSRDEIESVIEKIDLDFIIAEPSLLKDQQHAALKSAGLTKKKYCIIRRIGSAELPAEYYRSNPAFIRFSSGTTGTSKGVLLSHESIIDRTDAADKGMQITSEDKVLWVLSMSFHFVVTILLFLRRGATIVLCGHRFPDSLIEGITVHRGTFIYASPFHYSLLSRTDKLVSDSLGNVRMAISTAMKLPGQVAEAFYGKFGLELAEAYGIIEVGLPFIKLNNGQDKRGSVGAALPGFELRLYNRDPDGTGEIHIKGKGMLDAYFSPWQGRGDILNDGWFRTGDLGKIDSDGFLFILGRDKDLINFAGMKIFAQEVEAVINQHPKVKESLVFAVSHPVYGELPAARIVMIDGVADAAVLNELKRFCYQRLAQYKVPKDFQPVESIEKTTSGKIIRILDPGSRGR